MEKIKQMNFFKDFEKLQKEWIQTFDLKDINQDFIPKLPRELREYFKQNIYLKVGSLIKLINKDRIRSIDSFQVIRDTLENPDAVLRDKNDFIFAKDIGNHKLIFTSVAKNSNNELIVSSNSYKKISRIKNIILDGGQLIYEKKKGLLLKIIEDKNNIEMKQIKQKFSQEKIRSRSR